MIIININIIILIIAVIVKKKSIDDFIIVRKLTWFDRSGGWGRSTQSQFRLGESGGFGHGLDQVARFVSSRLCRFSSTSTFTVEQSADVVDPFIGLQTGVH